MEKIPVLPTLIVENVLNVSFSEERSLIVQTLQSEHETPIRLVIQIQPEALRKIVSALAHFATEARTSIEGLTKPPILQ